MGLLKKLLPIAGAVAGSFVGQPGLGAAIGGALAGGGGGGSGALTAGGGLLAAGLTKEQAQKSIEDYNKAQEGSVNAFTGARDASLGYLGKYETLGGVGAQGVTNMLTPGYQYNPTDPSYAFRYGEGMNALLRQQSAAGTLGSGGGQKAAIRYGQGIANSAYQQDFDNRFRTAGLGLTAANNMAQSQDQYARGIYNTLFSGAQGRDPARVAKGVAGAQQVAYGTDLAGQLFGGLLGGSGGGGGGFLDTGGFGWGGGSVLPTGGGTQLPTGDPSLDQYFGF